MKCQSCGKPAPTMKTVGNMTYWPNVACECGCRTFEGLATVESGPSQTEREAERYRYLRRVAPESLCAIAWRVPAACHHSDPDACIDAAIGAEPLAVPS